MSDYGFEEPPKQTVPVKLKEWLQDEKISFFDEDEYLRMPFKDKRMEEFFVSRGFESLDHEAMLIPLGAITEFANNEQI